MIKKEEAIIVNYEGTIALAITVKHPSKLVYFVVVIIPSQFYQ